jgi:pimeloyl-ACP methyl ester carboxylesterase
MTEIGTTRTELGQVTSADGTTIGWQESGQGPAAVLLHGTSGNRLNWRTPGPLLEPHLRLLAVDRRGRGLSGPGDPHSLDREVEDVAAVVASLDEPPHLVGFSYGAVIALAAAGAGVPVRSLVLYEPPLTDHPDQPGIIAACEQALAAGDPGGALAAFWGGIGELPALELIRSLPQVYELFLRDAHTIVREVRSVDDLPSPAELADGVAVPVLLMKGDQSHPWLVDSVDALAELLPTAEVHTFTDQGHSAPFFAPDAYAEVVLDFTARH